MKITRISYSESHESMSEMGLKKWNKLGMEADLEEGDIAEECMIELKRRVRQLQMATPANTNHPNAYWDKSNGILSISENPIPTVDYKAKEQTEIAIDNASSIEELEKLREDVLKYGLSTQYVNKIQSFQK